ncbi:MAG TPA: hypothetical protein ENO21_02595 [Firmicutes bacterium]|nr:hypothetical protein [Bacillota bacterium]
MKLFVSLPENRVDLARAAAAEGADALKVHMNVEHRASGTTFGTFAEEKDAVLRIIEAVDCPVGLMPGSSVESLPTAEELTSLHAAGLQFLDIYARHMPTWFIDLPHDLIVALDRFSGFVEEPFYLTHLFWPPGRSSTRISMCEASIFSPEEYGQPFTYFDWRQLRILQEYADAPLLVPTQKRITPDDARWLARTGTGGLMIGAVVTGRDAESIAAATAEYRKAIDEVAD